MSTGIGNHHSKRMRLSGMLGQGGRGPHLTTDEGDLWVLEVVDFDPALVGRRVTVEGSLAGLDRLQLDWIGAADD